MIITDLKFLRQKSEPANYDEGLKIIEKLRDELKITPGLGLSAPQIGILKRVALVSIPKKDEKELIVEEIPLINPIIIATYDPFIFQSESCLSIPGKKLNTNRFQYAHAMDDMHPTGFVCSNIEAVCLQHEVDHLNGDLFIDHEARKVGRNDPCPACLALGKTIKFKKCKEHFIQ